MNPTCSRIRDEMTVFADLGTDPPQVVQKGNTLVVHMYRNGEEVALGFHDNGAGQVVERCGDRRIHASYVALLASERFGDLRRWARTQSMLLHESLGEIYGSAGISIEGALSGDLKTLGYSQLDQFLASQDRCDDSVQLLLIDGPAGIGKTKFIEMIAYERAKTYAKSRRPLVLHVQSRGRVLSYLQDLMAFSLQRLRLSVTFDQLPVLVRHGLVTLAIDGFDELGDPNGYDLAWSQVNETIAQIRGRGTLLMAGRETFFGLERPKRALPTLKAQDAVYGLTLQPPSVDQAEKWLRKRGWTKKRINGVSDVLDPGSYALRPFFLAELAKTELADSVQRPGTDLLSILVEAMLDRESGKFGEQVERVLNEEQRRAYAHRFLRETAYFMADDQADIIDEPSLTLLVEMALPETVDDADEVLGLLQNRAGVIAFLVNDDLQPGYRRFSHSQLFNYFLSVAVVDLVGAEQLPKFVRRNIFSADFLAVFSDVLRHIADTDPERVERFFKSAREWVRNYRTIDRGARNLGAWLIASLPTMADIAEGDLRLGPLEVDETILKGTAQRGILHGVSMNQIDIRGADLRELDFDTCVVNTAIVDDGTRVGRTFPTPRRLRLQAIETSEDEDIWAPGSISAWLDRHGREDRVDHVAHAAPDAGGRRGKMLRLVERACRSSSFWIPEDTSTRVDRFVRDPLWSEVLSLLKEHDFIREKRLSASGNKSRFVHIKHADRLMARRPNDEEVTRFYEAVEVDAREG